MKLLMLIAVGFSSLICFMVGCMQLAGIAHPNLAATESLLQFYCTLFGCAFAAFPLTTLVIGSTVFLVDIVIKRIKA